MTKEKSINHNLNLQNLVSGEGGGTSDDHKTLNWKASLRNCSTRNMHVDSSRREELMVK